MIAWQALYLLSDFPRPECNLECMVKQIFDKLGELSWLFSRPSEACTGQALWESTHHSLTNCTNYVKPDKESGTISSQL